MRPDDPKHEDPRPIGQNPSGHNPSGQNPLDDMPVIFSYTRVQAIEDGVLVDLTEWSKETGFTIPVACTSAVWNGYVVPPESVKAWGQSERGRGHDLLWMLYLAIRGHKAGPPSDGPDLLYYEVLFQQSPRKTIKVRFKAHCGPGDNGEPVITIMMIDED